MFMSRVSLFWCGGTLKSKVKLMGSSDISIVLNMPVGEEFGKKAGRSDEILPKDTEHQAQVHVLCNLTL